MYVQTRLSLTRRDGARLARLAFAGALMAAAAAQAAIIEGEALYRERIMPPSDAMLVLTLEDTGRADAPAVELAASRMRLAGGPPYRFRLDVDDRLLAAPARPTLRARIETPQGLWMTTDTATTPGTTPLTLLLKSVPRSPEAADCGARDTQAAMNECTNEAFEASQGRLAEALRRVETTLPASRRANWRRVNSRWLAYRTEACRFEAAGAAGGSLAPMLQMQCATRLTDTRVAELQRQAAACREGDVTCRRP